MKKHHLTLKFDFTWHVMEDSPEGVRVMDALEKCMVGALAELAADVRLPVALSRVGNVFVDIQTLEVALCLLDDPCSK